MTLHKVRRMAAAGATSPMLAARFSLPVEQVEFVCGHTTPGERGGFCQLPDVIEVDARRCDPAVPLSYLPEFARLPSANADDLMDIWRLRWEEGHPDSE
jgi:hypothetical protein